MIAQESGARGTALAPGRTRGSEGKTREPQERFAFTVDELLARRPEPGKRVVLHDTVRKGLQLIIHPTGKRTFYFRRRKGYAWHRMFLGEFTGGPDGMSITAARKKAETIAGRFASGEDPGDERHKLRTELRGHELFDLWMAEHMKPHRRASSVANAEQLWRDYLAPTLATRKLSAITRGSVAALHGKIGLTRPTRANRALEVLSSMFSFALRRELAPAAWLGTNPCSAVHAYTERPRKRYLHADELARLFAALKAEPNRDLADFFLLSLWTAARRGNVQSMKWADVDLGAGVWTVAAEEAKGGEAMQLVLTGEALEILARRATARDELLARVRSRTLVSAPRLTMREAKTRRNEARQAETAAKFVFPGWGSTGHLAEPKTAWARVCKAAKITDLRIHDLRRSAGAWLAAGGANVFQIKAALGHKSLAAAGVYASLDVEPVRAAMEATGLAMRAAATKAEKESAKVVAIRKRGAR